MALGTTNITTTIAKNAISESTHAVMGLCSSSNINEWAKYKPANYLVGNDSFSGLDPVGPATTSSGGRLGDFRSYNHTAREPRYFDGTVSVTRPRYSTTYYQNVTLYKGEMRETTTRDGFNPVTWDKYDGTEDLANTLLGARLEVNLADHGNVIPLDEFNVITVVTDLSVGSYTLKGYYWARATVGGTWVKQNQIEEDSVSLIVANGPGDFDVENTVATPSEIHYTHATNNYTTDDIDISFDVVNLKGYTVTSTFWYTIGDTSGTIPISNTANQTKTYTLNLTNVLFQEGFELFEMKIDNSGGEFISGGSVIVEVINDY